jgi:hypothetical protein
MSAGAAPNPAPQRTIGEILLAHGYVDREQLDHALTRQQETGFPLGQILVEAGAITRLELASALAVQWSDMPIAVRLNDDDARQGVAAGDGGERKARLAPAPDPAWQEELSTSVRALASRLEHVEATLVSLTAAEEGERELDQLKARLDASEALLAETAGRSAEMLTANQLDERLGTVAAALETALSRSDELEARLDALASRPTGDPGLAEAVAALEERVSGVAQVTAEVAAGRARLDELEGRVAALADASQAPDASSTLEARLAAATEAWASERTALERRLDQLATQLEHARSSTTVPGSTPSDASGADDLNRLWFAVERISLQLTEHHRDIDRLLAATASESRLDELTARLDDLEDRATTTAWPEPGFGAAPASGDGGAPGSRALARKLDELQKAARSERERLLSQIDQIVGSLEWRLQRLEAASPTTPPLGS